jgi:hypothetical protein
MLRRMPEDTAPTVAKKVKLARRASRIWTDDELVYLHHLYIGRRMPASRCHELLIEKFGGTQTREQVYTTIESRGWSRKRRLLLDRAFTAITAAESNGAIVAKMKRDHRKAMEEFVDSSREGAQKAFGMIRGATSPRELSAAASAASSLIRTYRLCAGLDDKSHAGGNTFNFNFAATPVTDAVADATPVEVTQA